MIQPSQDPGALVKKQSAWLGVPPVVVGVLAGLCLLTVAGVVQLNFYFGSRRLIEDSLRDSLLRGARVAASAVDPAVHRTFTDPAQETTPEYAAAINRLRGAQAAVEGPEHFKFVYTCVQKEDGVHFVLDTTPEGDGDGDGIDDKSHVMQSYDEASPLLRRVLAGGRAEMEPEPTTDRWGTFMSAYAPIVGESGAVEAIAGVDMEVSTFQAKIADVTRMAWVGTLGIFCLSVLAGLGAWTYHRRLQGTISKLVESSHAAQTASRAKSAFLATMSHELRTPMNGVIGVADLLSNTALDRQQRELLDTIRQSGDTLLALINDILDFSKIEAGKLTLERVPVVLSELVGHTVRLFAPMAQARRLELQSHVDPASPAVFFGDPTRLRQVLTNLTANALKFTTKGRIDLRVEPATLDDGRPALHFSVQDTGIGISDEQRQRLFRIFSQGDDSTTRRFGGTGLGLAVCDRLCRAMGGRIWVESAEGVGSTFHVIVAAEPPASAEAATAPPATATDAVLVICANRTVRSLVSRQLEKLGHTVSGAASLEEAVRAPAARAVVLDLALAPADAVDFVAQSRQLLGQQRHATWSVLDSGLTDSQAQQVRALGIERILPAMPRLPDLEAV